MLIVQLNEEKDEVVTYFASHQDDDVYPDLAEIEATDPMWMDFYERCGGAQSGLPEPE